MSSGLATFYRPDGTTAGYGIYYGNADILYGFVAGTPEDAWKAKAEGDPYPDCTCGQPPEPVVILSEYGGEWCPRCRCIIGPYAPTVCQVCHENPYYSEPHECVRIETHEGRPSLPGRGTPAPTL